MSILSNHILQWGKLLKVEVVKRREHRKEKQTRYQCSGTPTCIRQLGKYNSYKKGSKGEKEQKQNIRAKSQSTPKHMRQMKEGHLMLKQE